MYFDLKLLTQKYILELMHFVMMLY